MVPSVSPNIVVGLGRRRFGDSRRRLSAERSSAALKDSSLIAPTYHPKLKSFGASGRDLHEKTNGTGRWATRNRPRPLCRVKVCLIKVNACPTLDLVGARVCPGGSRRNGFRVPFPTERAALRFVRFPDALCQSVGSR